MKKRKKIAVGDLKLNDVVPFAKKFATVLSIAQIDGLVEVAYQTMEGVERVRYFEKGRLTVLR